MRIRAGALAAALAAAVAAGCTQANYTHSDRYEQGLVVCLSGAGGMMGETDRLREGLAAGHVYRAIETFEWSRGGVLEDQTDVDANRRKASELARRVENYQRSYPDRPVHLIGVSAGTGLVVWALEDLGPGAQVTGAILISSSLDTKYDLSKALAKVSDRLYSFNSVADTVLSLGVTWAGTVDRGGGLAGGLVGFSPPDSASDDTKALYKQRLTEISWWPGDMVLGHLGDHLGATNPSYVREKIAPIVLGKQPDLATPADEKPGAVPEAVRNNNGPKTAAYAKLLEERRQEEARLKAEKQKAGEAASPADARKDEAPTPAPKATIDTPPQDQHPPQKSGGKKGDGGRIIEWNVRRKPAPSALGPVDVSQFFAEPRRLP
jgi:pimeloyl-ACP methyl ester carboxylesterase